jgi:hypothetical protein
VASDPPPQPSHLTLVELAINYGLFAGLGYWAAGALGAWVGAGLVSARYAYRIWVAARAPAAEPSAGTAAERDAASDRGGV